MEYSGRSLPGGLPSVQPSSGELRKSTKQICKHLATRRLFCGSHGEQILIVAIRVRLRVSVSLCVCVCVCVSVSVSVNVSLVYLPHWRR